MRKPTRDEVEKAIWEEGFRYQFLNEKGIAEAYRVAAIDFIRTTLREMYEDMTEGSKWGFMRQDLEKKYGL